MALPGPPRVLQSYGGSWKIPAEGQAGCHARRMKSNVASCRPSQKEVRKKRTFACKQNHWKPLELFASTLLPLLPLCCLVLLLCNDVVHLVCWYTRISAAQEMAAPLALRGSQTSSWRILWLLAFLLRESDAFFLAAPCTVRHHRSRSPINSSEKDGHVATVQQQQQQRLLSSHGRRRRFGQVCTLRWWWWCCCHGYHPTEQKPANFGDESQHRLIGNRSRSVRRCGQRAKAMKATFFQERTEL